MKRASRIWGWALVLAGLLLAAWALRGAFESPRPTPLPPETTVQPTKTPEPAPEPTPEPTPDTVDGLPVGKLVITSQRKEYRDGDLTIYIPAIRITRKIYNGTENKVLDKGVGLYEYAQLPGEGNRNVSLAGHRNGISNGKITDRAPFYYIDTLEEGDYLYLYDAAYIYRYVWEFCEIVEADDWDPIRTTGYPCLTITSCHPIGISDHRIVVRGALEEIIPYDKDYAFPKSSEEVSQ